MEGDLQALQELRDRGFFEKKSPTDGFAVSNAQRRLWVIDQMLGGKTPAYNMPGSLLLEGPLDVRALETVLVEILRRHESLRTSFSSTDGVPCQKVHESVDFALERVDLRGHDRPEEAARRRGQDHAAVPFDIEKAPLFRAELLHLDGPDPGSAGVADEGRHVLLYNLHHIICDEWSLGVLVRELAVLYRAFVNKQPSPLPPLPLQYKDFAARQSRQLQTEETDRARRYWLDKLAGDLEPLRLATDYFRPAVQTFAGNSVLAHFDSGTSQALRRISRNHRASLYVTLLALVKTLFHRYTGQEDVTIGCPVAGREDVDLEDQIGFYVNTLALRDRVLPSDTFAQLIEKVRQTVTEGIAHQTYPFESILAHLDLGRDMSHSPLFDVVVTLSDDQQKVGLEGIRVREFDTGFVQAKFDFVFDFADGEEGIDVRLIYNSDLYAEERIDCMMKHLGNLARAVSQAPEVPLRTLEIIDTEERRLLESFNPPKSSYPTGRTIHELFEEQVSKTPDRIALVDTDEVSYRNLNTRVNRWAHGLRQRLVIQAETAVGVLVRETDHLVPALLAILKAGGTYVPIDPALPAERARYLLEDSRCRAILTDIQNAEVLELSPMPVVAPAALDDVSETSNPAPLTGSRSMAYVIYTSGSTGLPKGVMVEHEGFVNMIHGQIMEFGVTADDRVLQFASCAFDASLSEIFMALLAGAALVTVPEAVKKNPRRLAEFITSRRVDIATIPPSYLRAIGFDELRGLKTLVSAGEDAIHDGGSFAAEGRRYINAYGPTEFSVCATTFTVPPGFAANRAIPIGRPVANAEVLILEVGGDRLQPLDVAGEICLSGVNMARGYVNLPQRTEESFQPHPLRHGDRIYRTGDLGRWLPDGTIVFLGRLDQQIKINGYRIELGEIESQLVRHAQIDEAAAAIRDRPSDSGDVREIVAYIVPAGRAGADAPAKISDLRSFLGQSLPDYMVPAHFVVVNEIPRTESGKLDRKNLPDPSADMESRPESFVQPEGDLEERLSAIWRDILGVARVGADDGFLDLGGNSMKAIVLAGRVLGGLHVKLDIREIFEMPTVRQLAEVIRGRGRQNAVPVDPIADAEFYAVSHAQRRLWIIDRMDLSRAAYSIASVTRLRGDLDPEILERAMVALTERHESLRTRFVEVEGEPRQGVDETVDGFFRFEDLSGAADPARQAQEQAIAEAGLEFDLSQAPLFRATLYCVAGADHVLTFSMHHIISDGSSLDIIVGELFELYEGLRSGRVSTRPPLRIQYRDYARWQNDRIAGDEMDGEKRYWQECLGGDVPLLDLPVDAPRPAIQSFRGAIDPFDLPDDASAAIRELAREHRTSLFAACTAAVKVLLFRYTGADDIVVGAPVAGRNHPDLQDQVGFFVNMLALRDRLTATDSVSETIQRVKSTIETALDHSFYPFDLLVEDLDLDRDTGRNPLFDVVVSFRDAPTQTGRIRGLDIKPVAFEPGISKFDLTFFFEEKEDRSIGLAIEYSTDLFRRERIQRMTDHLNELLRSMVCDPSADIGGINILPRAERARLLEISGPTATEYPTDATLVELFEEQVRRGPDRMAAVDRQDRFDYRKLNDVANHVATEILLRVNLRDEEPVGILLERSAWSAVAVLAILKAGGSYLPLDSAYPAERLAFIMAETGCRLLLTGDEQEETLRSCCPGLLTINLTHLALNVDSGTPAPDVHGGAGSLAYTMYTSGSTGHPKGVQIEQRSVTRLVRNTDYVALSEQDYILQAGSLAFDASTFEIWGALLNGACVCFPPGKSLLEPDLLRQEISGFGVTTMFMTASLFNQMVDADIRVFADLRQILVGGERLSPHHVQRVRKEYPNLIMINGYGPTENTTFTACHRIEQVDAGDIPLGRPIANTSVYVLDDNLQLCPTGVPGEICTGGDGVARGYLADPGLTRERFVANPYLERDVLYRTGDFGSWNPDGTLSFLRRVDTQVKIRGFRVEPGEIEHRMQEHPDLNAACVLPHQTSAGTYELVGYYTANAEIEARSLRDVLSKRLPHYMVPGHFVYMERFPVNENGKLDRDGFPDFQVSAIGQYQAPVTDGEKVIARILAEVLGPERVGLGDNFFELGGDSIRAIQVVSRLRQEKLGLRIKDLFQTRDVQDLASRIRLDGAVSRAKNISGMVPLTPIQEWFFHEHEHDLHHFNQSILLTCSSRIDEAAFREVFEALHHHHDMLRTTFHRSSDGWEQEVRDGLGVFLEVVDLRDVSIPVAALEDHAAQVQSSFDFFTGPLAKAVIYRLPDTDRLLVTIHHLLVDGVSWRILLEDLESGYQQRQRGTAITFAERTDSYLIWSQSLRQFAQADEFKEDALFWQETEAVETTDVPLDFDRAGVENLYQQTEFVAASLSEAETRAFLTQSHRVYQAEADAVLLTALGRSLHRWHRGVSTRVLVEGHGRESLGEDQDLTRTVGWFTSMYPVVLPSSGADDRQAIRETKEALRRIPHRGVSYGVSRYLSSTPLAPSRQQPALVFNYLGQFDSTSDSDTVGESVFSFAEEAHGSVFGQGVRRQVDLEVTGIVSAQKLQLSVTYHPGLHRRATVASFLEDYRQALLELVDHCRNTSVTEKTPTDFTRCTLSLADYDAFLATTNWRPEDIADVYPLSSMQAGLLYQDTLDSDSGAYFLQMSFALKGTLDIDCFHSAWEEIVKRHEILRTAFVQEGLPEPLQVILKHRPPAFLVEDISSLPTTEQHRKISDFCALDKERGFDLKEDSLVRFAVFRLDSKRHQVIWSYHHILLDGWSLGNLYKEFHRLYGARVTGSISQLPPVRQFSHYVEWLQYFDADKAQAFWGERLKGVEQVTSIPILPGSQPEEEYRMGEITFQLTEELSRAVAELAQQSGVTVSTLMQVAWAVILCRYQNTTDIVFGSIVSGRPSELEHVEEMVGLFINAIPQRIRLEEDQPFAELLRTVQDEAMETEPYHCYPLAEIHALTPFQQGVFEHLFVFENYPTDRIVSESADDSEAGFTVGSLTSHDESHYPFNLIVVPGDAIEFRLTFNEHIYPEEQIRQVQGHLLSTLTQVVEKPFAPVGEIQVLPAEEREQLDRLHGPASLAPAGETVLDLIHGRVRSTPERTALIQEGRSMCYDLLNRRANQLARYLRESFSVGPNDRVGIALDRSETMVVSILGVLKAGGAYLPIDTGLPAEYITFMLADSETRVVLAESRFAGLLVASDSVAVVYLDEVDEEIRCLDEHELAHSPAGADAAYVMYTSGSTGIPKGSVVEHRNLLSYVTWASDHYFDRPEVGHFGLFSSLSFDLTVSSLFLPLIRGNSLTIYASDTEMHDILADMIGPQSRVDSLKITPSHISLLTEFEVSGDAGIQVAIVGGEALLADQVALLHGLNPAMRVFNEYGPTEATVGCMTYEVPPQARHIPIGRPIANTHIYVLDQQQRLAPMGTPGEIYIAGSGVARGYLNRVGLTAERFLDSPFRRGERLYRSGDLGRWLPDGNMEYLGRCDDQVKIRGHRIEPGEIESALLEHPRVERVAVVASDLQPAGNTELAAYVVGDATSQALRDWVSQRLPDYMIPTWFVSLDALPLTHNGKLDRRALPDPTQANSTGGALDDDGAPRDELESRLRDIWAEVLRVDSLSIHDDFFELGGHSLKATQIVSRVLKKMDIKLSLRDFFRHNTVAELAQKIRPIARQNRFAGIQPAPYRESYEPSHAQKRLWLLDRLGDAASYNIPQAYLLRGDLDVEALRATFDGLVVRHEVLRTAFVEVDGEPRQKILPSLKIVLQPTDLTDAEDPEGEARNLVELEAARPFDLARPPLLRVRLLKIGTEEFVLVMNMHHIVGDGWSMNILFHETMELFHSFCTGKPHALRSLRIQYKDFSEWQNQQPFEREETYWLKQLAGNAGGIRLPFDFPTTESHDFRGALETTQIDAELLTALRHLAQSRETTLANLFLALFKLFLFRLTKQEDLCVGVSIASRNHPDLENLLGFFVNVLPVRTSLSANMEFDSLLNSVSQVAYEAYDHQDYPFDLMVAKLNPDRVANRQPLINVLYAFQNYGDVHMDVAAEGAAATADDDTGLQIEPFPFAHSTAKFDLTLFAFDDADRLLLHMEYDTSRFRPETIRKYLDALVRFASMITSHVG